MPEGRKALPCLESWYLPGHAWVEPEEYSCDLPAGHPGKHQVNFPDRSGYLRWAA